jgi:hypothetical protein
MIKIKIVLFVILALLVSADFFIPKEHAAIQWESIPGFYALFGILASIILLVVSKMLGFLVQKKENYYDD